MEIPPEIEAATSLKALTGSGVREGNIANKPGLKQLIRDVNWPTDSLVARNNKELRHWLSSIA
jgi:hypothetical protein